jgi:septal ring factor EnvC (AmiA/AmiB activator)
VTAIALKVFAWGWERRKTIGLALLVVAAVSAVAGGWVLWSIECRSHKVTKGELQLADQRIERLRSDIAAFETSIEACKESQDSVNAFVDSLNTRNSALERALAQRDAATAELRARVDQAEADFAARLAAAETCPGKAGEMDRSIRELFNAETN